MMKNADRFFSSPSMRAPENAHLFRLPVLLWKIDHVFNTLNINNMKIIYYLSAIF
jgi:hypothetical protein